MNRDEIFFYAVILTVVGALTANAILDLGLLDRLNAPVELQDVKFEEVKPIFEQRCIKCHSDPHWNWTDYETAFKNRDKIKFRVWTLRTMPPGGMPNEDRLKIRDWVDGGGQQ